ncbi:hypothetical protein [Microbulbifer zhoushanensis]|uniref:hypothetical protein n=1 Tax=Microbulbifer TaxID=48073 RepID=UPI001F2D6DB4|nr:hypothetical protein [Microbulbifer zhoushanensis]
MAMWKQALASLRHASRQVLADNGDPDAPRPGPSLQPGPETAATPPDAPTSQGAPTAEAIEIQLNEGMQVSLSSLEPTPVGWTYRRHPVMVFGVEVPEVEDADRRREFWQRVHLLPCCGALDSGERSAWIGTDLEMMRSSFADSPLTLCQSCLTTLNHDDYRRADSRERQQIQQAFDFVGHVQRFSHQYFDTGYTFWQPGEAPSPADESSLVTEEKEEKGIEACPGCGCASDQAGWRLPGSIGNQHSLPAGICIPCAVRQTRGCLHIDEEVALTAARLRFEYFAATYRGKMENSWKLAEAILPLTWLPLLRGLEKLLPAPELFYQFESGRAPAVLAWPGQHRGILPDGASTAEPPTDWSLWTRREILREFGLKDS